MNRLAQYAGPYYMTRIVPNPSIIARARQLATQGHEKIQVEIHAKRLADAKAYAHPNIEGIERRWFKEFVEKREGKVAQEQFE